MDVIIIEDEYASSEYLKNILKQHFSQLDIVAQTDNVPDSIALIRKLAPGIVYLDVEIRMGTGFDVLSAVKDIPFAVVFTTAFNTFAVDAFRHNAVDYLVKPLQREQVIEATERAIQRAGNSHSNEDIGKILERLHRTVSAPRLAVSTMSGLEFVAYDDICYIEGDGNYTKLKLRSGRSIAMTKRIKDLEEQLFLPTFIRIHHSYIVNTRFIRKYTRGRGGHIELEDGSSLPVSQNRKDDFLKFFGEGL